MNYKVSVIKNIRKSLLLALLLGNLFVPLHAAKMSNYAEMTAALVSVPFDMAGQHYTLQDDAKKAAAFHLTADTLSILNKVLFFYNNITNQKLQGELNWKDKACMVQGGFLIRDLTKFYTHFKELRYGKAVEEIGEDAFNDDFELLDEKTEQEVSKEVSKLAYAWQVVGIPALKGLTAFAMACTQDYTTKYSGKEARSVATAAYSLIRLVEECNALKPNSGYRKILEAALFINTVWLVYEVKQYWNQPKMVHRIGHCAVCTEDDQELLQLHCGHGYCRDCLNGHVQAQYTDRGPQFDRTPCPHVGPPQPGVPAGLPCGQPMTRHEMREITNNDSVKMQRFDRAIGERLQTPEGRADAATLRDMQLRGGMPCPGCRQGTIKRDQACDHITCPCGNQFCYRCGINWVRNPGWQNPHLNYHDGRAPIPCNQRPHYIHHDPYPHILDLLT